MHITKYTVYTDKPGIDMRVACVSDLHSRPYQKALKALKDISPDVILLPGDIVEIAAEYMDTRNKDGIEFLKASASIAPTFYTYGNHEIYYSHAKLGHSKTPDPDLYNKRIDNIKSFGVHVINDSHESFSPNPATENRVIIGGLVCGRDKDPSQCNKPIDQSFINDFCSLDGFKILLCHYPHYYKEFLDASDVDLILSGHAHGGQWRIFGRGVYAPHQGIFPQYTSGIHENKLIISRGAANNLRFIPRFFNPCEILEIRIISK